MYAWCCEEDEVVGFTTPEHTCVCVWSDAFGTSKQTLQIHKSKNHEENLMRARGSDLVARVFSPTKAYLATKPVFAHLE